MSPLLLPLWLLQFILLLPRSHLVSSLSLPFNSSLSPRCSSLLSLSRPSLPPAVDAYMPYIALEDYVPPSIYCYLPSTDMKKKSSSCSVSPRWMRTFSSIPWEEYEKFSFRNTIITDANPPNSTFQDWFTSFVKSQASQPCTSGLTQMTSLVFSMINSIGPSGWQVRFNDFIISHSLYAILLNDEGNLMFKGLVDNKDFNFEFHTNSQDGIYNEPHPGYGNHPPVIVLQQVEGYNSTNLTEIEPPRNIPLKTVTPLVEEEEGSTGLNITEIDEENPEYEILFQEIGHHEQEDEGNFLDKTAHGVSQFLVHYLRNETNWSQATEATDCMIDYLSESENTMLEILVTNITKEEVVDTVRRLTESIELLVEHENLEEGMLSVATAFVERIKAIDFDKIALSFHKMVLRARTGAFGVNIAELLTTFMDLLTAFNEAVEAFKSGDWPEVNTFVNNLVAIIESEEFWIGLDNAYLESVTNAKTMYYSRILSYRDAFLNTLRHVTTRLEFFVNDFEQNFDDLVEHIDKMSLDSCIVKAMEQPVAWLGPVATTHGQIACWFKDFSEKVSKMECLNMDWVGDVTGLEKEKWPEMPKRLIEFGHKMKDGGFKIIEEVVGNCPRDGWFLWL